MTLQISRDEIIGAYGPQLGEMAWHAVHVDDRIRTISEEHAASILHAADYCQPGQSTHPIRILEIGAYAHYGAHRAAAELGGMSVSHDVSPASLRVGLEGALTAGIEVNATLVAGDFHDLPFATGYFDIVFCASSVHHTFHPWKVLHEMMRVLRPGGVLRLENEPIGRALSFYGFRSNRTELHTAFESTLAQRGSLFTFSSPFPGSRPETLFGMIENERIPLDMFLDTLNANGTLASSVLRHQIEGFERSVLALSTGPDLESELAALIMKEIQEALPNLTRRDEILGARLPARDEVWRLCYQVAPLLRDLKHLTGVEHERQLARLFGSAIQATIIKHNSEPDFDEPKTMFQRPLQFEDGVFNDLPNLPGLRLHVTASPIPSINIENLSALTAFFPESDWEAYIEENGLPSLHNLTSSCRITLPPLLTPSIAVFRFYAVLAATPYAIRLSLPDGTELTRAAVAQSESMLFREVLPEGTSHVFIETVTLDDDKVLLPRHIRLTVAKIIPVERDGSFS